ncbi:MAG: hypothetical protein OHK0012_14850 [Synechococcales cyanobacterium]
MALTVALGTYSYGWSQAYSDQIQVKQLLQSTTTSLGQPIDLSALNPAQVTAIHVVVPPGQSTGWHKHPHPGFAYILRGTLTLETEAQTLTFSQGEAFVEMVDTAHNGHNRGTEPLEIVAFFPSVPGQPFAVPHVLP